MANHPLVVPTIVRFTMNHTCGNSRRASNIVDVSVDETGSTRHDAVAGIVNAIRDAWQDNLMNLMGNTITFNGGHFTDLDSLGGISGDFSPNTGKATVGGVTNAQTSPNTAYLVKKNTAHNRKQRPGRMYIAGVDETVTDASGIVLGTFKTAADAKLASFKTAVFNAGGIIPPVTTSWRVTHVVSVDSDGDPDAWNSSDITTAVLDTRVASQRRRNRG